MNREVSRWAESGITLDYGSLMASQCQGSEACCCAVETSMVPMCLSCGSLMVHDVKGLKPAVVPSGPRWCPSRFRGKGNPSSMGSLF